MTKLAQQFNKAGIVGKSRCNPKPDIGWNYKAQRAYVRGRFENVVPVPCPIYNHKAEQIVRALIVADPLEAITQVGALSGSIHYNVEPEQLFKIGKILPNGKVICFPDNASALAILGYNAQAVLHWLGGMRLMDDLTDQPIEVTVNDGQYVYSTVGVLLRLAKDCVLHKPEIMAFYRSTVNGK